MKKSKTFSRKLCAGILSVCLTVGVLAGNFILETGKNVSGAITSFTKNDFLKCCGTSIRNNACKGKASMGVTQVYNQVVNNIHNLVFLNRSH